MLPRFSQGGSASASTNLPLTHLQGVQECRIWPRCYAILVEGEERLDDPQQPRRHTAMDQPVDISGEKSACPS
jgi:hypothetical protein